LCAAIRRTEEIDDTYIIMSSTLGSASDQQKGFESGVDEYVTKPVVISELLDRIKKVFTAVHTGRENILILEDDELVAKNITKSLSKQGFAARIAGRHSSATKPDALITGPQRFRGGDSDQASFESRSSTLTPPCLRV